MKHKIELEVNGKKVEREVEPRLLLVHFLREELGLTGTNVGCETSLCGACTVLVDGKAVKSCTQLALQADEHELSTIESLGTSEEDLHPIQEAFWEKHGLQCGYCTPGMILTAAFLLSYSPRPSKDEIRHALKGNLCRCTGYHNIVEAIEHAASKMAATAS